MKELLKKIHFSFQAVVLAVVLSVTFFLLGVEKFKVYQSEVTILVIAKSANAINQQNQILNNLIQLPRLLSFYDKMLRENHSIKDVTSGKNSDQRKKIWNSMLSVEQSDSGSSAILVSASSENEASSNLIASKTVRTLFDTTSLYYNVKEDVDLRIIDGPITRVVVVGWPLMLLVSIILGSLISAALGQISIIRKKATDFQDMLNKNNPLRDLSFSRKNNQPMPIEALENLYKEEEHNQSAYTENDLPVADQVLTKTVSHQENVAAEEIVHLQEIANRGVYPNFPEMPIHSQVKSAAPDNLPIADFSMETGLSNAETPSPSAEALENDATPKEKIHEPTTEELKKRLNQLLQGEL